MTQHIIETPLGIDKRPRFYLDSEPRNPLSRDTDVRWRVRDSHGRHGNTSIHPIVYRGSHRECASLAKQLNATR